MNENLDVNSSPRLELSHLRIYCFLRLSAISSFLARGLTLLTLLVGLALRLAFAVPLNFSVWKVCRNVDVLVSV